MIRALKANSELAGPRDGILYSSDDLSRLHAITAGFDAVAGTKAINIFEA